MKKQLLNPIFVKCGVFVLLAWLGFGCNQKDIAIATFKGDMIYSYLDSTQNYSEFIKIINKAGLKGMLSAYGDYTCLAPSNKALETYYKSMGPKFTIDSLTQGQIDTLARTHIIPGRYLTTTLDNGVVPRPNMNNRYIETRFDTITSRISFNDSSNIILKDLEVYNGVIQGIDHVLKPANVQLPDLINENPNLSIFSQALQLTRLSDSLRLMEDLAYANDPKIKEPYYGSSDYSKPLYVPKHRKYGYTAFIEPNDVLQKAGINNLTDLIQKAKQWYPPRKGEPVVADNDYTNHYNSLNKFIAYHLINKMVIPSALFASFGSKNFVSKYLPDEYLETMLTYRIIRLSKINNLSTLNTQTDFTTHVIDGKGKTTVNGVYNILDNVLVYTEGQNAGTVENMLLHTRMRFDATSLFPELMNNNIRGTYKSEAEYDGDDVDIYGIRNGYLSGLKTSKDTKLQYLSSKGGPTYMADAMEFTGAYDITLRLLPVPPGTYEIRYGYTVFQDNRGITQIYLDNKPVGIPLNLAISLTDPAIGAVKDVNTDDNGYENDKMIRNRGYMKGLNCVLYGTTIDRDYIQPGYGAARRIIATVTFTDYEAHTLRFKNVTQFLGKVCVVDFFEMTPKSVYDNPSGEPESRD